jgi:Rrf2 family protein
MKISTKGRYGTRAMIDIAENYGSGPVSLRQLTNRQCLSLKYMEQIIPLLKSSGLIRSARGARGGYVLAKKPSEISLRDIVEALEGSWSLVDCIDDPGLCDRTNECGAYDVWNDIQAAMYQILDSTTLADMTALSKKKSKAAASRKHS